MHEDFDATRRTHPMSSVSVALSQFSFLYKHKALPPLPNGSGKVQHY